MQFYKAFPAFSLLLQGYRLVSPILFISFSEQCSYYLYSIFALVFDTANSKTTIVSRRAVTTMIPSIEFKDLPDT